MNSGKKFKYLINITGGILESLEGLKSQSEHRIKSKIASTLRNFDFVEREEFNEMKALVVRTREEIEKLNKQIINLENKIKKK